MSIEAMKRIKSLLQYCTKIDSHTISAVVAECDMAILAQQPATPEPVAWMASYVDPVGNDHVYVTSHHDLAVENDMHGTPRPLVFGDTHPAQSVFLVRDIASLLGASVPDVCNALAELGYEPRRSTNAAISPDEALAVASRLRPAPSAPKDDQIAALVNKVRDIARMFHDHQSLRERIAIELVPALKASQEVKSNAERYRFIRDADVSDDLIPDIALYAMESLDEYIDAAMLAAKEK